MPTRRYEIETDSDITMAILTIWEHEKSSGVDRAIGRQGVRADKKHATLNGLTHLLLHDYFHWITPEASRLPQATKAQQQAVARPITRRLNGSLRVTITSTEIGTKLLTLFVAPVPDQWSQRYSVCRSHAKGAWTVSQAKNGTWGCSCPRWRFKQEQCKHIEAVQQHPNWYPYVHASSWI